MAETNIVKLPGAEPTDDRELEKKWGKKVVDCGFTVIPSILVQGQRRLGLSPVQLNVLLQLLDHWWVHKRLPYPAVKTIAERMDMTDRYVRTVIGQLEEAGFLKRNPRFTRFGDSDTNAYDLSGLVEKIQNLEPEFTRAKEEKRRIQQSLETPRGRRRR